ncbi:MAG: orotate phosphoribosyltransferase [Chitinophagales bacterium]|jgi:orotate phosphoribosyltransferase|nr:orotate phosphoribosyltransferase [Bacteroidota bacterium]MBK9554577.1 orotate phosphoribosyltransferase [Bacteroidota bacterium]MBL0282067.1 orotate phosphoribosyltransferase [Bacteroidota bacterium]MBP8249323.1 orotate phosphoribosyltransferase [Chitinophagales bacterium]MBP9880046.1 orotate phosphoribosyltransferase [Chitinophagales bacterium]
MLFNSSDATLFAEKLLTIGAIKLRPNEPFTWASGWRSPIYCDNRLTLSYPEIRTWLKNTLAAGISQTFPNVEIIAGVATAGIPHGALVAEALNLPFIYVRSEAKKHGLSNQIEGKLPEGAKVMVIEDLVSTGGSSLTAVNALRNAGAQVEGMAALFTYAFDAADDAFKNADCKLYTLSDYPSLIQYALANNIIPKETESLLGEWRKNPGAWMQ